MENYLNTQKERDDMEIYGEYLRKIPDLLKQLETVERMARKAQSEAEMLRGREIDHSVALYSQKLNRIEKQCETREADIIEQLRLIFSLKGRIEKDSPTLRFLMEE